MCRIEGKTGVFSFTFFEWLFQCYHMPQDNACDTFQCYPEVFNIENTLMSRRGMLSYGKLFGLKLILSPKEQKLHFKAQAQCSAFERQKLFIRWRDIEKVKKFLSKCKNKIKIHSFAHRQSKRVKSIKEFNGNKSSDGYKCFQADDSNVLSVF